MLSFPEHRGSNGRRRPYMIPMDGNSRRAVEGQVLAALGLEAEKAP